MATSEQWLKMWEEGVFHFAMDHQEAHHHENNKDQKRVGGHGTEVDQYLLRHLNSLTEGKDNLSIFITLCGNSPDLAWLCEKGYDVVGCEISEKAVKQLFENKVLGGKIDYEMKEEGDVKIYSATNGMKLKVYVGDFFGALSPDMTGTFDCIWDCHGIISVPANLHTTYAEKVIKFLKPGGRMLFSTLSCEDPKETTGNAVSALRIAELFPSFTVKVLENLESPHMAERTNPVTLLTSITKDK